ncbi:MAG: methionine ABC transporter ATP-binding protein, partial [Pseudonocardiaceae bacterium]
RRLVVDLEAPHAALTGLPGVLDVTVEADGLRQQLAFSANQTSAAELIAAVVAQVAVRDLFVVEPSIEDVVRTLYTP